MSQIFHPSTNVIARATILGGIFILGAIVLALGAYNRSDYVTGVNVHIEQPIQFSHEHHVSGLGIDCRYCHTSVDKSPYAGIPPTETCMTCHSQVWADSPYLQPVRESYASGVPLQWERVHSLGDFVYFNHSIHVNKGIGCQTCHGEVDQMPLMRQDQPLTMVWCLNCHREPEKFIRPVDQVYNMNYEQPANQLELGRQLVKEYNVRGPELLTNCNICHR